MRNLKIILLALVILFPAYCYSSTVPPALGALRISLIQGDVQIKAEDADEWAAAAINMPLRDGDRLWVPEAGRVELQIRGTTYLRLNENSSLDILRVERGSYQFYMARGHAYVSFGGTGSLLQIDMPACSVRAYDRANFRIDVSDDGYTEISVFKGAIYAENRGGRTRVSAGRTLSLRDEQYAEISPLGPSDEWERWNRDRDRRLSVQRYSYRYLPDELRAYSYDLDENGRWVYVRQYGYVWTPTVVVSIGWAPYRVGRWVWIGGDYVWVSYEPWGWVPYHYGRWAFIVNIGWCWVPPARGAVYWGPGFVGWVYTPAYVAWVPLAPGEIYYGYGYYGPHSVNVINIDIRRTEIKTVYKNVYVRDAVTVVHHDTFVRGKPVEVRVKDNPFLRERISVGRPPINPVRETRMPVVRDIPMAKQPPASIRDLRVRELRESRPLVVDKTTSVLRPGAIPKEMPVKRLKEPAPQREIRPFERRVPEESIPRKEMSPLERPKMREPVPQKGPLPLEKPGHGEPLRKKEVTPLERPAPHGSGQKEPGSFLERKIEKPGPERQTGIAPKKPLKTKEDVPQADRNEGEENLMRSPQKIK